jgi:hypothetical protein
MPTVLLVVLLASGALAPPHASAQIDLRIRADPMGDDVRYLNGEYALVTNETTTPLDVSGWRLCNGIYACFVFPAETVIGAGDDLRIHSGSGRDTPRAIYMGRDRPMWANWADYATLRDPDGGLRASCYWDRGRGIDCSPP